MKSVKIFALIATALMFSTIFTFVTSGSPTENDEVLNKYSFTGKEYESESNLYYFGARHYDCGPSVGRFTSVDPAPWDATNPQTMNRYTYCLNNPKRFIDPDGRAVAEVLITLGYLAYETHPYWSYALENPDKVGEWGLVAILAGYAIYEALTVEAGVKGTVAGASIMTLGAATDLALSEAVPDVLASPIAPPIAIPIEIDIDIDKAEVIPMPPPCYDDGGELPHYWVAVHPAFIGEPGSPVTGFYTNYGGPTAFEALASIAFIEGIASEFGFSGFGYGGYHIFKVNTAIYKSHGGTRLSIVNNHFTYLIGRIPLASIEVPSDLSYLELCRQKSKALGQPDGWPPITFRSGYTGPSLNDLRRMVE